MDGASPDNFTYGYFNVSGRVVRMTYIMGEVPFRTEIPDLSTKTLTIDNQFIDIIAQSLDAVEIDKNAFDQWCNENGIKTD